MYRFFRLSSVVSCIKLLIALKVLKKNRYLPLEKNWSEQDADAV